MAKSLPITLVHLKDRLCVIVGGGADAPRKARPLLDAGARVRVIAPQLVDSLGAYAQAGRIEWIARDYSVGDLDDAFLVIAAAEDGAVDRAVSVEAAMRQCLANIAQVPEVTNFVTPAVIRRGYLTLAVCTGGALPVLSSHLRVHLKTEFGPEWQTYLELFDRLRPYIADHYSDVRAQRAAWERVLDFDPSALGRMIDDDGADAALEYLMNCV